MGGGAVWNEKLPALRPVILKAIGGYKQCEYKKSNQRNIQLHITSRI